MTSDPRLRRWVLRFNDLHFGGELPTDRITIYWEPCGRNAATTALDGEEWIIRMDPALHIVPRHAKLDVNHELVHVKLWPERHLADHGKRFDEEIQRLTKFRSYRKLL